MTHYAPEKTTRRLPSRWSHPHTGCVPFTTIRRVYWRHWGTYGERAILDYEHRSPGTGVRSYG